MKAIIPLSPPSYKQGNLPGNVKDLCTYARNLQEQVDFYLGQLQKGVESINALYNYSEETKTLNIIPATSFNAAVAVGGKLTASGDLAVNGTLNANNGGYFRGFSLVEGGFVGADGGEGYVQVMTITITGTYANSPIVFEFTGRGYAPVRGYILFKNENSSDPGLEAAVHEGELNVPFYLVKSAASTWKVYIQKVEAYDSIAITRLSYNRDYGMLSIDVTRKNNNILISSLPSGAIVSTADHSVTTSRKAALRSASIGGNDVAAVVVAAGVSGIWTWKKYSDGTAECWGVLDVGNVSADKLNEWGALYEAVISSGVDFPFAFTSPPCLIRGISTTNGAGMVMEYTPTAGNTGKTSLVLTSKVEVAGVKIHFHASGRWK